MSRFLLYQPGGKPFLAFPRGSGKPALAMFPATTWKKKSVLYYLIAADTARVKLPAISYHDNVSIFATSIQALSQLAKNQGVYSCQPLLVMWNKEYRRGRAYLWLGDNQSCKSTAFAKIGSTEINQGDFSREYNALTVLSNKNITFKIPRPISFSIKGDTSILLTSSLPIDKTRYSILPWTFIDTHLSPVTLASQKKITYSQLETLEWFKHFSSSISDVTFQTINSMLYKDSIDIGFIHGDMGSENTFIIGDHLWIVDWEKSSPQGPIVSDQVGHWLGNAVAKIGLNTNLIEKFKKVFIESKRFKPNNILLALCYLKLNNFPPANFVFCVLEKHKFKLF